MYRAGSTLKLALKCRAIHFQQSLGWIGGKTYEAFNRVFISAILNGLGFAIFMLAEYAFSVSSIVVFSFIFVCPLGK